MFWDLDLIEGIKTDCILLVIGMFALFWDLDLIEGIKTKEDGVVIVFIGHCFEI